MDTYWIFDFTAHYFSISSIFLFITYMAKNILIVTAFRIKFQIFLFRKLRLFHFDGSLKTSPTQSSHPKFAPRGWRMAGGPYRA